MRPAHTAHGGATHGVEEGLYAFLVTAFRCVAVDVLHWDDAFGVQLIHHCRGFFGGVDLAAAANADDQHIGVAQQHPVGRCELSSGGTEVGKVEAPLLPAPEGGVAKSEDRCNLRGIAYAVNSLKRNK